MSWILLANDDGVDSPALAPFARALTALDRGEVRVVAPDDERSWTGKAITRFDPVHVERVERGGVTMWACSGTPADGVQLGIHALFDDGPPALVVSGINLAFNHGAGFVLSSGTVGAATEGWISGLPAIAVSAGTLAMDFGEWRSLTRSEAAREGWEHIAELGAELVAETLDAGLHGLADVVNINVPWEADATTPRRVTSLARLGYDRLFQPVGEDAYAHDFGGGILEFDSFEGTDVDAANEGWVSITPLRMPETVAVPARVRATLERREIPSG